MSFEFVLMYLLVDLFCLGFSLVIYSKITVDMGTEREMRALRLLILSYDLFLLFDALWASGEYDLVPMTEAATGILEAATMLVMGIVACSWFLYAENKLNAPYADKRRFMFLSAIPVAIVFALYATTRVTGWIYTIGPDASFTDGPIAALPMFVFLAYVVFASVHALICFVRERSSVRRAEISTLIWFAVPPTFCGILDLLIHGMPVVALSTFASILLVFMSSQDSRINTDALTGLNNRRRAMQYVEDSMSSLDENGVFGICMIDVDYFKDINDSYGHAEGDRALQLIAEGLRHAMGGYHGLAARWGGDEFLVATHLDSAKSSVELEESIQRSILSTCEHAGVGYPVSVSTGFALASDGEDIGRLVAAADRVLYDCKKEHHAALRR